MVHIAISFGESSGLIVVTNLWPVPATVTMPTGGQTGIVQATYHLSRVGTLSIPHSGSANPIKQKITKDLNYISPHVLEEKEVDPLYGVEFIEGVKFDLGVENPLLCCGPVGVGLSSDDPTGL